MDPTRDSVGFLRGPQPLEVNGSLADVSYSPSSHPPTTTALEGIHDEQNSEEVTEQGTVVPSHDDLFHFLDSLSPRLSEAANPAHVQQDHHQQQSVTGPSSTSLSVQSTPSLTFTEHLDHASSSLGFFFDPLVVSVCDDNNYNKQIQDNQLKSLSSLSSTFATNGKGFDARDINMPFDLSLPLFDTIAYPVVHPHQSIPPYEKSSSTAPLGSGIDPVALDSTLDSPLALSQDASPWSDLLASPMFSLPESGTVSETPLPPLDSPNVAPSLSEPTGSLFPPLPTPSALPYDSMATTLRPLPPVPVRLDFALPTPPPPTSAETPSPTDIKPRRKQSRPEPSGFRTSIPLLDLDAPIQTRNPVLASSTSRKRITAGAEKALAKKRARQEASPTPAVAEPLACVESQGEVAELPADIMAQVERKRLQNTMSARKSRMRKQAKMQELEQENRLLMEENAKLKAQLETFLGLQHQ